VISEVFVEVFETLADGVEELVVRLMYKSLYLNHLEGQHQLIDVVD
jgi:hypothetical protein